MELSPEVVGFSLLILGILLVAGKWICVFTHLLSVAYRHRSVRPAYCCIRTGAVADHHCSHHCRLAASRTFLFQEENSG